MLGRSVAPSAGSGSRAPERVWWLARPIGLCPITTHSRLLCLIRTRLEDGWCADVQRDPRKVVDWGQLNAIVQGGPRPPRLVFIMWDDWANGSTMSSSRRGSVERSRLAPGLRRHSVSARVAGRVHRPESVREKRLCLERASLPREFDQVLRDQLRPFRLGSPDLAAVDDVSHCYDPRRVAAAPPPLRRGSHEKESGPIPR